jgi:hypothetical protein
MPFPIILIQVAGLVLLAAGVWLGYRRWVHPRTDLDMQGRGLLLLLTLTCVGGAVGLPVWWADQPWAFSWDLPPLAGRMLGAAAATFVVLCIIVLERPAAPRLRLVLWLLAVYLVPLVGAILLFHLGSFDFSSPVTYVFFLIAAGMSAAAVWFLVRFPSGLPAERSEPPSLMRSWLIGIAAVTALWGLALFVTDRGPLSLLWVWPGDLLTSRLIAVMLLAIASGAIVSLRSADTARLMLIALLTYGLGIVLAAVWGAVSGAPIQLAYLAVFGAIALGSAAVLRQGSGAGASS